MPSWHQRQNPTRLDHDTLWTLVTESHMTSLSTHSSYDEAKAQGDRIREHHPDTRYYILKPRNLNQ